MISQTNAKTEKQVAFAEVAIEARDGSFMTTELAQRFSGLHADSLPLPTDPDTTSVAIDDQPVVAAESLQPLPLNIQDCYPLPKASLVPSYILAGTKHFTMQEVKASVLTMGSFNLLFYGRLMFSSAVRGFAALPTQGVYTPVHQRRLVPSSQDWSNANMSIKHASEILTPASFNDFDVWRPSGHDFAAVQESSYTADDVSNRKRQRLSPLHQEPSGGVKAFLLLGESEEALRYCDLVFCSDHRSARRARAFSKAHSSKVVDDTDLARAANEPLFDRR